MKPKYCTACGVELVAREAGDHKSVAYCPLCQGPHFGMFNTAVLVAVINGSRVALLKQHYISTTHWVLVAGYIEKGELPEAAVSREVLEETGLTVQQCTYISSYYHSKRELLMLGFVAHIGDTGFTVSKEVDDVQWFPLEQAGEFMRQGSIGQEHLAKVAGYLERQGAPAS
ncbi:MAG: NUDIX domain-containing protein [Bacillota bacterium]